MKYNYKKVLFKIIIILLIILSLSLKCFAHSGRTDANGGHKDNKNKSGLGSYHYHCGGHEAHLHPNGVCPYSSSSKKSSSSSTSKSTSSTKSSNKSTSNSSSINKTNTDSSSTSKKEIPATDIKITNIAGKVEVGDIKFLNATVTPDNATDKAIKWETNNSNIATVTATGMLTAINEGTVTITATTSNNKSDSIEINIEKEQNIYTNNQTNNKSISNTSSTNEEDSNAGEAIIALGLLGGGGYLGYKKYKNSNR